jgi:hypothetical protein
MNFYTNCLTVLLVLLLSLIFMFQTTNFSKNMLIFSLSVLLNLFTTLSPMFPYFHSSLLTKYNIHYSTTLLTTIITRKLYERLIGGRGGCSLGEGQRHDKAAFVVKMQFINNTVKNKNVKVRWNKFLIILKCCIFISNCCKNLIESLTLICLKRVSPKDKRRRLS